MARIEEKGHYCSRRRPTALFWPIFQILGVMGRFRPFPVKVRFLRRKAFIYKKLLEREVFLANAKTTVYKQSQRLMMPPLVRRGQERIWRKRAQF